MIILDIMMDVFSAGYLGFVFGGLLDLGDVIEMLMVDLKKDAYH